MGRQDWRTPPSVFELLSDTFGGFDCDVAADDANHLCGWYLDEGRGPPDCINWGAMNFCNPPFGDIRPWVETAICALELHRHRTVMLTHANANSPWFTRAIRHAALYCPTRRISYWHPDENCTGADRDTVVWHFGGDAGTVAVLPLHDHSAEIKRLVSEARGQTVLQPSGLVLKG